MNCITKLPNFLFYDEKYFDFTIYTYGDYKHTIISTKVYQYLVHHTDGSDVVIKFEKTAEN